MPVRTDCAYQACRNTQLANQTWFVINLAVILGHSDGNQNGPKQTECHSLISPWRSSSRTISSPHCTQLPLLERVKSLRPSQTQYPLQYAFHPLVCYLVISESLAVSFVSAIATADSKDFQAEELIQQLGDGAVLSLIECHNLM